MIPEEKIDLYKIHKEEYSANKNTPRILEIKPANYLTFTGQGDPSKEPFQEAIGALYSVAFTTKMTMKKDTGVNYTVCKLEGQWWVDKNDHDFINQPRDSWNYRLIIRTPDFVTRDDVDGAIEKALGKGKARADEVNLETINEGLSVQALHIGPFADEGPLIKSMEDFAAQHNLEFHNRHHEIYLSDFRRVTPDKLRTILRHPVKPKP